MNIRMALSLLLALLAPFAHAAEWQPLGKNNLLTAYVDVSSIEQRDGSLVADVLMEYFTEQTAEEFPKPYRSIVIRSAYNCQLERTTTLTITVFSGPTASGERVQESVMKDVDSNWLEVPAGGLRREVFAFVCSKAK
jgi:hypothetical protein